MTFWIEPDCCLLTLAPALRPARQRADLERKGPQAAEDAKGRCSGGTSSSVPWGFRGDSNSNIRAFWRNIPIVQFAGAQVEHNHVALTPARHEARRCDWIKSLFFILGPYSGLIVALSKCYGTSDESRTSRRGPRVINLPWPARSFSITASITRFRVAHPFLSHESVAQRRLAVSGMRGDAPASPAGFSDVSCGGHAVLADRDLRSIAARLSAGRFHRQKRQQKD